MSTNVKRPKTKVVLRVEIEVDAEEYELAYGVAPEDQRDDLAQHIGNGISVGVAGEVTHRVNWKRLAR